MTREQYTDCEELFDASGVAICEGDEVRVNGAYVAHAHLDGNSKFHIDGWPTGAVIESLEVIKRLPIDIDAVHPMIKE